MDPTQRSAIVLDNGSGFTKMGFGGNLEPSFVIPTVVACHDSFAASAALAAPGANAVSPAQQQQQAHVAALMADLDVHVGEAAYAAARSGPYKLTHPVQRGQIEAWDAMEHLWQQALFKYMRVEPEEHVLLLAESPLTPPEHREYIAEIMFETFNVAGLYMASQPSLALTAANTAAQVPMTGVVVDAGFGSASVVPVVEGYVLGGSSRSMPVGGAHSTAFVQQLMRDRGEPVPAEEAIEVARKVKETYGYTCSDLVKEFTKHDREPNKYRKVWTATNARTNTPYRCDVGHERFLAAEVFFSPEIAVSNVGTSLAELVDAAVQTAAIDTRRSLYKNIVLSGGSTLFKDFGRRLQRDVKKAIEARMAGSSEPKASDIEVTVVSHHLQEHAVWFGGSVVASSPGFQGVCTTRAAYLEHGPSVCRANRMISASLS
ncbi:unnamed protein product [Closterium sp. Yama58-4]|nr:unnamed protein product [Closterium sp. Yama58-4]